MATINYKGMKLEEFVSDKLEIFNPPKKCVCWNSIINDSPGRLNEWDMYAYIPYAPHFKVATCSTQNFAHCALLPEKPEPRRATNREFARWIARGNGEHLENGSAYICVGYDKDKGNDPVKEGILVRKWDDTEWHEPTVDYLGIGEEG